MTDIESVRVITREEMDQARSDLEEYAAQNADAVDALQVLLETHCLGKSNMLCVSAVAVQLAAVAHHCELSGGPPAICIITAAANFALHMQMGPNEPGEKGAQLDASKN